MKAPLLLSVCLMATSLSPVVQAEDWRKEAQGREVDCLLQVQGKTYLKGTCKYDAASDGSFGLFGDNYFLYLHTLDAGLANAFWNAKPTNVQALTPLGEDFKRKGACWVGKNAKICAWDKQATAVQPTRIKFQRGATSAVVTGKLTGFKAEQHYIIEVGKGQTMQIAPLNPNTHLVTLAISAPDGSDVTDMDLSCNNRKTVKPTQAGDYRVSVRECMKADEWKGEFKLKVSVK